MRRWHWNEGVVYFNLDNVDKQGVKKHFQRTLLTVSSCLLFFILGIVSLLGLLFHVPPLDSSWSSSSEGRLQRKVDVFLRIQSNHEWRDVDHLFPNSDVSLSDQYSSMMDRLCESMLEDLRLEPSFHEVFDLQSKDVIELHLGFLEDSESDQSSQDCISFEESFRILLIQSKQLSSSLPDLGQSQLYSPYFSLVLESKFSDYFEFLIKSLLLEGSPGSYEGLGVFSLNSDHGSVVEEVNNKIQRWCPRQ